MITQDWNDELGMAQCVITDISNGVILTGYGKAICHDDDIKWKSAKIIQRKWRKNIIKHSLKKKTNSNINYELRKIIEKYKTVQAFADAFGCTYTHMLNLLNGKTNWSLDNARKAAAFFVNPYLTKNFASLGKSLP